MQLSNKSKKLYNALMFDASITDKNKLTDFIYNPKNDYSVNGWYTELFDEPPSPELEPKEVKDKIIEKLENA